MALLALQHGYSEDQDFMDTCKVTDKYQNILHSFGCDFGLALFTKGSPYYSKRDTQLFYWIFSLPLGKGCGMNSE